MDDERKFNPVTPEVRKDATRPDFLRATEKQAAEGGLYRPNRQASGTEEAQKQEERAGGLYSGGGKSEKSSGGLGRFKIGGGKGKAKGKGGFGKKSAGIFVAVLVIFGVGIVALGAPMLMIGGIDFNLQDALGFADTIAVLEKQGEYVTDELLAEGEFESEYADRLAANGIEVGQVTLAGEFVRTNVYIAGLGEGTETAATGEFYAQGDGSLALRFKDRIIRAGEFVAAVESDAELKKAYDEAANISALYYYSSDVDAVYQEMGASRDAFQSWQKTGNVEADQASYYEILNSMLDSANSNLTGADCIGLTDASCQTTTVSDTDAAKITGSIASRTTWDDSGAANRRAAELLNATISAGEPYKAVSAFLAIEEPIQQARIDGGGPVNETMNALSTETEVTYTDVNTGEEITTKNSILTSKNFTAAVSSGRYSTDEAANFSRDRVFAAVGVERGGNKDDDEWSTVRADGENKADGAIGINGGVSADGWVLAKATNSVDNAVVKKNSEMFQSTVGGNRAVEGGAFLSGTINQRVSGAMPSDAGTIAAYHQETESILAWKAEADRSTMSPFDISSPNTFLGNIVYNLGNMVVRSFGSSGQNSIASTIGAVANLSAESIAVAFSGTAVADGDDDSYAMTHGKCATTKSAADVEGDIYCTQKNTYNTSLMKRTQAEWDQVMVDKRDDDYADFITMAMDRGSTVGVKDAEVCEKWKEGHANFIGEISDFLAEFVGIYMSCGYGPFGGEVPKETSTGSEYTLSGSNEYSENTKLFSAFTLHDVVYNLLKGRQSTASRIKEEYYKEHPKDESAAGIVARATGMTKSEATLALAYGAYLTEIANYDAGERFAFEGVKVEKDLILEQKSQIEGAIYAFVSERTKYADIRNRSFAV